MMKGAATVLAVSDVAASLVYYRDVLGFLVTFEYGDPLSYACLYRDEVAVHLIGAGASKRQAGQGAICAFVTDVDALHAEFAERQASIVNAPDDRVYGMRDFDVRDLDGNQLTFGMQVAATP
jgi:catechol 2,3-dioxygenase-like lactoylglutathione lyase family enzyme